ncbi:hypothetical protein [Pontibacter akesuensis]|uniref:Lipoprotein n=1 Tax=Pontibacter akesuensis TaxID=388950 RepID=A0A1I7IEN7_9BACT|nr:hypothetical protein [Pontibacter akesuensis]GHA66839.1 hypothetical protein GCM10007389_19900 [Pontibacter akesuensis]SFU71424.1 hypothetical protein SAMN04487941_2159 [Pontibacter akesuensis]
MKTNLLAIAALLALFACGSDSADGNYNRAASDELIDAQVDSATKTSTDSLARATKEGKILQPLPDTLTSLLEQKQPQAQIATLTDQAMASDRLKVGNPVYLRGDFNGNASLDYAVQVLKNDSIHILAYLDYNKQARELKVASYPAKNLKDGWFSTYQLRLAPQDSLVQDNRAQKLVPLPTDGISVIGEDLTTLYMLQNGRFIPFDAKR